jgi:hypothetical protein
VRSAIRRRTKNDLDSYSYFVIECLIGYCLFHIIYSYNWGEEMTYAFLIASAIMLAAGFYLSRPTGFVMAYVLLMIYILVERAK